MTGAHKNLDQIGHFGALKRPFWGPLAAILYYAVGAVFQTSKNLPGFGQSVIRLSFSSHLAHIGIWPKLYLNQKLFLDQKVFVTNFLSVINFFLKLTSFLDPMPFFWFESFLAQNCFNQNLFFD